MILGTAISKAVNGNMEGFIGIGELIGDALKIGMKASIQKIGAEGTNLVLESLKGLPNFMISDFVSGGAASNKIDSAKTRIDIGGRAMARQTLLRGSERLASQYNNLNQMALFHSMDRPTSSGMSIGGVNLKEAGATEQQTQAIREIKYRIDDMMRLFSQPPN